jgi:co-chaperonin GroES (HSP10)
MMSELKYEPRNDFVILRLSKRSTTAGGVGLPDTAAEGMVWHVVAAGPKVEDLKPGDQVEAMGTINQDIAPVIRTKDLFITKEANVLLKVVKE